MTTFPKCPLCEDDTEGVFYGNLGDSFYQVTDYRADLFRCKKCRSLFQGPLPDPHIIPSFYPSGYWREETGSASFFAKLQRAYATQIMRWDLNHWLNKLGLKPGAKFLDIGCGRGDFLAQASAKGLKVKGLESDPRAAETARKKYGLTIEEKLVEDWTPEATPYDAISMLHVLEHLRDPKTALLKCREALKPNGKLLLRVPNEASWQSKWMGVSWKGLEIPRHLLLFNPRSFLKIIENTGYSLVEQSTWSLRDGPPALTSSLLPNGEPTRQQIMQKPNRIMVLAYFGLNTLVTPLEWLSALLGKGGMITVIVQKTDATKPF